MNKKRLVNRGMESKLVTRRFIDVSVRNSIWCRWMDGVEVAKTAKAFFWDECCEPVDYVKLFVEVNCSDILEKRRDSK